MDNEKHMFELKSCAMAICTYIRWIQECNDPKDIRVFIDAIEEVRKNGPVQLISSTKEAIKTGQGDFSKIQKKCIQLKLV